MFWFQRGDEKVMLFLLIVMNSTWFFFLFQILDTFDSIYSLILPTYPSHLHDGHTNHGSRYIQGYKSLLLLEHDYYFNVIFVQQKVDTRWKSYTEGENEQELCITRCWCCFDGYFFLYFLLVFLFFFLYFDTLLLVPTSLLPLLLILQLSYCSIHLLLLKFSSLSSSDSYHHLTLLSE